MDGALGGASPEQRVVTKKGQHIECKVSCQVTAALRTVQSTGEEHERGMLLSMRLVEGSHGVVTRDYPWYT